MKIFALLLLIVFTALFIYVFFSGLIIHEHLVLEESDSLRIVERSIISDNSAGKDLWIPKIGLPVESVLTSDYYTVEIKTPLNFGPVAFLKIYDQAGTPLDIEGEYIKNVHPAALLLNEYEYIFMVDEANGKKLEFRVIDKEGLRYPLHSLNYKVVSRGYTWAIK